MTQPGAMLLSIAIEAPLALLIARFAVNGEPSVRLALVAVATTLITHPFAWSGVRALTPAVGDPWVALAIVEIGVAIVEGWLYTGVAGLGWRWGFAISAIVNAVTTLVGVGLYFART